MATRMVHDKIPHNPRVVKTRASRDADNLPNLEDYNLKNGTETYGRGMGSEAHESRHRDARGRALYRIGTAPIYNREPTVKPGGERFKTRFADDAANLSVHAHSLVGGMDAIIKMRDSGDAELEAMSRDPRLLKTIDAAISKLGAAVDSLVREYQANSTDDPEALVTGQITGQDGAWHAFDAETIQLREAANKRASELRHAANAVNPTRVQLGLADDVDLDPIGTMNRLFGNK